MKNSQIDTQKLNSLVQELIKTNPDQKTVKRLMSEQGLEYQFDSAENMTSVLKMLGQVELTKALKSPRLDNEGVL